MTRASDKLNSKGLPLIPLDLSTRKLPIFLNWLPIVLTSGILPIAGFFGLRYGTTLALNIVLSPWLGLMGVVSIFSLLRRSWALVKKDSTCRPLGQHGRWGLDFFGWNFLFGFLMLTAFISAGITAENLTIVSLPLSILMLYVCFEIVVSPIAMAAGMRAPFRMSSVAKGEALRPAVYVIVEDVVAVDGKQGQAFRQAWSDRYEASAEFRRHLQRMDWLWGMTGLAVVAAVWGVVFGLMDTKVHREIGYALGWSLPWLWAGTMTVITISMSKSMLRREAGSHVMNESA